MEEETNNWHSSSISQERLCEIGAIYKLQMSQIRCWHKILSFRVLNIFFIYVIFTNVTRSDYKKY